MKRQKETFEYNFNDEFENGENERSSQDNLLYIPINSGLDGRPVYVNPKQFKAILTRRAKKVKQKIKNSILLSGLKIKKKYIKRSSHAKQRE